MKKILIYLFTVTTLFGAANPASAHGWRGGHGAYAGAWRGGERNYGWAPYAVGAVAGAVVTNAYYRSAPVYYQPQYYPAQRTAAYCPENGLYYPQTQVCPSGWQMVVY